MDIATLLSRVQHKRKAPGTYWRDFGSELMGNGEYCVLCAFNVSPERVIAWFRECGCPSVRTEQGKFNQQWRLYVKVGE